MGNYPNEINFSKKLIDKALLQASSKLALADDNQADDDSKSEEDDVDD